MSEWLKSTLGTRIGRSWGGIPRGFKCDAARALITVDVSRFELLLVKLPANAINYRHRAKSEHRANLIG